MDCCQCLIYVCNDGSASTLVDLLACWSGWESNSCLFNNNVYGLDGQLTTRHCHFPCQEEIPSFSLSLLSISMQRDFLARGLFVEPPEANITKDNFFYNWQLTKPNLFYFPNMWVVKAAYALNGWRTLLVRGWEFISRMVMKSVCDKLAARSTRVGQFLILWAKLRFTSWYNFIECGSSATGRLSKKWSQKKRALLIARGWDTIISSTR